MTGTSINPLLRAAFLARGRDADMVTLMVPFLSLEDQPKVKRYSKIEIETLTRVYCCCTLED